MDQSTGPPCLELKVSIVLEGINTNGEATEI